MAVKYTQIVGGERPGVHHGSFICAKAAEGVRFPPPGHGTP